MRHIPVSVDIPEREITDGLLCLTDDNRHWIEIPSRGFGYGDFFVPVIFATDKRSGEVYTCIQCHFKTSQLGSSTLHITELIIDEHSPTAVKPHYMGIHAEINGLADWSGAKRAIFSLSIDKVEARSLPDESFKYQIAEDKELVIENWCKYSTGGQIISFETKSRVCINSNTPASRLTLYHYLVDFLRILSLFIESMPSLSKVQLIDVDGRFKELQRSDFRVRDTRSMISFLNFQPRIEPHFGKIVETYHKDTEDWRKVFDLVNESQQNKTAEVSFLNITTALEILHKYFLADTNRNLMKEYNDTLLSEGVLDKKQKGWVNVTRYYHLYEHVANLPYFQQRIAKKFNFCRQIRNTRNWYTHYDDLKGKIWTPAQLIPVNNLLAGIARAVILQLLGLPDELINKLISAQALIFYNNFEANQYSLLYREDVFAEGEENAQE